MTVPPPITMPEGCTTIRPSPMTAPGRISQPVTAWHAHMTIMASGRRPRTWSVWATRWDHAMNSPG